MSVSLAARTLVVIATIGGWVVCPGSARASGPDRVQAVLTYSPDADIARCPTSAELADAVAARIGYDPFERTGSAPDAARREVIVGVHREGTGIAGVLELRGPHPGTRALSSPSGDCRELLDALAVAIAIGLDPGSLSRPPGEPPPPATSAPPAAATPAPAAVAVETTPARPVDHATPPPPSEERPDVRLGAGPVVMFGELPATAAAVGVTVGVRWKWLEPTVEGIASLPAERNVSIGRVSASLIAAGIVPCGHADVFFGCVGLTLGALSGEGDGVASPRRGSQLYAATSARAGVELAVSRSVWVRGYAEAVAPVTRITAQLAAQDVWRMPSVAARVGAAAGIRF